MVWHCFAKISKAFHEKETCMAAYIAPDFYIYRLALMKASQMCKLLSLGSDETVAFLDHFFFLHAFNLNL